MKSGCLFPIIGKNEEPSMSKPIVYKMTVSAEDVKKDMDYFGLRWMRSPVDTKYQYCKEESWAKVFDYLYFEYEIDKEMWIPQFCDCDDFAFYLRSVCAMKFGLNIVVVFGKIPLGYHAWNIFQVPGDTPEKRWMQIEPQTRNIAAWGEGEGKPVEVYT